MTIQLQPGQLVFRPGQKISAISSNRIALAGALLRGKPAQAAPLYLPRLYALCGQAHHLTSRLAIDAACGIRCDTTMQEQASLAEETAREHVRRIWLDWPRLFGRSDDNKAVLAGLESLRACPLLQGGALAGVPVSLQAFCSWLELAVLGQPVTEWLGHWQLNPVACMQDWVARADTFPAQLLRDIKDDALQLQPCAMPLLPHADEAGLRALARSIISDENFCRAPTIGGEIRETGIGSRIICLGKAGNMDAPSVISTWQRFGARIAELALLSGATLDNLALGSIMLAPGEALAWSEMARGLLLHWVRLESADPQAAIVDYRIVAPTEWNFHPSGVVAKALAAMPLATCALSREQEIRHIGILTAAFDPCITYKIEFDHA